MEREKSIQCSQERATGLYPEPNESSSCHLICLYEIHLRIILYLLVCLPSGLFPSGFLLNPVKLGAGIA
jgi:hypothetical protein